MTRSVNDRQTKVRSVYTDQGAPRAIGLPNVTRWSSYTRQSQTEITRPTSQHSHAFNA
jgi:hypothetical protein